MRPVRAISRVEAVERAEQASPDLVSTLAKGLDVLAVLAGGELLGNQQIAQRAGLSKATASRLCATLATLGYLRQDGASRKYAMGARLLAMGATVQHRSGLLRLARPGMEALARETGMMVGMGARERLGMVCLDVAHDDAALVGTTSVGSILPMAETALGLAYLARAGLAERIPLLRQLQLAYGADWAQVRARIEEARLQYLRQGYVVRPLSCEAGVSGVAAAVELPGNMGLVAFNCATRSDASGVDARLRQAGLRLRTMVAGIAPGAMP